jgi:phospholipid/cholesterol/gamma-HCH transport system substrate-binding protein
VKQLGLEFRVGLFTILGLLTAGFLVWFVDPTRFETSSTSTYYTIIRDASGIVAKTHVKTNGVTVGRVTGVSLLPDQSSTKIEFAIDSKVRIPLGSILDVRTVGLLGDKFIEVIRTEAAPDGFIEEGGLIPRSGDGIEVGELLRIAGAIAKDVKKITGTLAQSIGKNSGEDKLANIIDNIEAITDNFNAVLVDNRTNLRSMIANLSETAGVLQAVLNDDNRDRFERIFDAFDSSMKNVRGATQNINLIAEKVQNGEGTLGKLLADEEMIAEVQGAVRDLRQILGPASRLKINVDYRIEGRKDKTTQHYFNLIMRTRPDRFYLLGLSTSEYDVVDTTTETLTPDASFDTENQPVRERTSTTATGKILINLQMAKRWYFSQLRFGLFESTGGLASDFYGWGDRLRLSLEAFDWKTTQNEIRRAAHLKAYASVLFFNHIYTFVGIDDPTKYGVDGKERGADGLMFGAGFNFDDDDLKAVFGAAAIAVQ